MIFAGVATSEEAAERGESACSPILATARGDQAAQPQVGRRTLHAAVLGAATLLLVGAATARGGLIRAAGAARTEGPLQTLGFSEEHGEANGSQAFLLVSGDPNLTKTGLMGLMCMGTKVTYGDQVIMLLCDPDESPRWRFDGGYLKMGDQCVTRDAQKNGTLIVQSCGGALAQQWAWKDGKIIFKDSAAGDKSMCLNYANYTLSLQGCAADGEVSQQFLGVQPSQLSCSRPTGQRYTRCQLTEQGSARPFLLVGGDTKTSATGLMCMGTKASYGVQAIMILCDPDSSARLRFDAGYLKMGDGCVTGDSQLNGTVTVQSCGGGLKQQWTWKAGQIVFSKATGQQSSCLTYANSSLSVRGCADNGEASQRFLQVQPSELACSKPQGQRYTKCQLK